MQLGHHQKMHRRPRVDVMEGKDLVILVHLARRNLARNDLAEEAVVEELRPIRERYEKLVADKAYLESCYRKADEIALKISSRTMGKVMKKIGFI